MQNQYACILLIVCCFTIGYKQFVLDCSVCVRIRREKRFIITVVKLSDQ